MHLVQGQPPMHPHRCGVLPQLVNVAVDPNTRYVDTDIDHDILGGLRERLYVSETAVKEMARVLGHPTNAEHIRVLAENEALKTEIADLREEMKEYDRRFQAIDILESADFRARRKVGRPKSTPTQKAA